MRGRGGGERAGEEKRGERRGIGGEREGREREITREREIRRRGGPLWTSVVLLLYVGFLV